jgi:hypothetical protein
MALSLAKWRSGGREGLSGMVMAAVSVPSPPSASARCALCMHAMRERDMPCPEAADLGSFVTRNSPGAV